MSHGLPLQLDVTFLSSKRFDFALVQYKSNDDDEQSQSLLCKPNRLQSPRRSLRRRPRSAISHPTTIHPTNTNGKPDYYKNVPQDFHIIGFDGSGTVLEVGPDCEFYKPGDDVSYIGSPTRQGSNAEFQLVNELSCALKPKSFDFVEAASYGLTFGTAWQSLNDRLEIKAGEDVGILIVGRGFLLSILDRSVWCWL